MLPQFDAGRPRRSVLYMPGANARALEKARTLDADALILDLEDAVARIVFGAFYQSGQSCIGVQRLYVHADVYDEFKAKLLKATKALKSGDPKNEETFIGPMISESEAKRLKGWIDEALKAGGTLLCGGGLKGATLEATLLENVDPEQKVCAEEAFGPVAVLEPFDNYDKVLAKINDSRFGLQAGIFTRDLYQAHKAWDVLLG